MPTPHKCHPLLAIKPPCDITAVLNPHLQGALEWLQWTSPTTSAPTSQYSMPQHSTPKRKLPCVPWVLCPPSEQKILLAWSGQTQLSLIPWLPLHWHPWPRLCQNTSPALFGSVIHTPCMLCHKLWMWPVPPIHSLEFPLGAIQPTCPRRCFNCKGRWTQPWNSC